MNTELIRDALDNARSSGLKDQPIFGPKRLHSAERVYAILVTFIRDLPEDMTVAELRQELEDIHHEL